MVACADQQVRELVSDHASQQLASVYAGDGCQGLHAVGERRRERAGLLPDVDE